MAKRAERRHQRDRMLKKYEPVAKKHAGKLNDWIHKWKSTGRRNARGLPLLDHYIDHEGFTKRMKFIEREKRRLVAHHKHQCEMCKGPRYNRRKDQPKVEHD